ncbi:MAG: pseudouridine synthase [Desulfatibacillaceae bacterium]|nr:pseudouridine synthase [Desulfatibacillaceae bacterium]
MKRELKKGGRPLPGKKSLPQKKSSPPKQAQADTGLVRLQKFMAHAGICSRRKAEQLIAEGRVRVNGKVVTAMGTLVDPATDRVDCDGKPARADIAPLYVALNKPKGFVSSCEHPGQRVVTELVKIPGRLYPIGRLDKDSTGLILLTNDGDLHLKLSHPRYDHEKEYQVGLEKEISDKDLAHLAGGVMIHGRRTRPAKVVRTGPKEFAITLKEGRNRQIRHMARAVDNEVRTLHRVRVAHVQLGNLPSGQWRLLSDQEVKAFDGQIQNKEKP